MEIIRIDDLPLKKTPRGVSGRQIVDLPDIHVMNLVLNPGEEVPVHKTAVDVLFHVIAGKGSITIESETEEVQEGQIIISPAGIPHALRADAGNNLNVLVIKTPNPKKKAIT